MKIAKASQRDIDAMIEIGAILNAVNDGYLPNGEDEDPIEFDHNDHTHLRSFYKQISQQMNISPGCVLRVIWGYGAILDSGLLDPNAKVLEPNPELIAAAIENNNDIAKCIATEFYYWWNAQPGTNTQDGFDNWWTLNKERLVGPRRDQNQSPLPTQETNVVTCVYCGHQYPDGTPTAKHALLSEHIKVCDKHPMREAEQKIHRLQAALAGLVGADTKEELDAMEVFLRSTPAPNSDKEAAINAIDALRECI